MLTMQLSYCREEVLLYSDVDDGLEGFGAGFSGFGAVGGVEDLDCAVGM